MFALMHAFAPGLRRFSAGGVTPQFDWARSHMPRRAQPQPAALVDYAPATVAS